jgi:hypothetical protein
MDIKKEEIDAPREDNIVDRTREMKSSGEDNIRW